VTVQPPTAGGDEKPESKESGGGGSNLIAFATISGGLCVAIGFAIFRSRRT
jgi:hypothetical protein